MAWDQLVTMLGGLNQPSAQENAIKALGAQVGDILAALLAVATADVLSSGSELMKLEWKVATFSYQHFTALRQGLNKGDQTELDAARDRLRRCLEDLATRIRAGDAAGTLAAREPLIVFQEDLARLDPKATVSIRRRRRVLSSVTAVPTIAAGIAGYFIHDHGFQLERMEVLRPAAAYEFVQDTPRARPDYRAQFMLEFSKFYFGEGNRFREIYFDPRADASPTRREPARTLVHKVAFRNSSHTSTRFVSSVEAVVQAIGPAPFPWNELTVTPHLSAEREGDSSEVSLKSDGVGPALDLEWSVRAGDLVVYQGREAIFHHRSLRPLGGEAPDTLSTAVVNGALIAPLYRRLPGRPAAPDATRDLEVTHQPEGRCANRPEDLGWYEVIRTPARLRELTPTAFNEPSRLEARYVSLRGEHGVFESTGSFGSNVVFYRANAALRSVSPMCGSSEGVIGMGPAGALGHGAGLGSSGYGSGGGGGGLRSALQSPFVENLARMFVHEPAAPQPRGVDLLPARLDIDLLALPLGGRIGANTTVDGFSNAQGLLSVTMTLNAPSALRYDVTLLVNGAPSAHYQFDGMVPDYFSFREEGPERAVARLRTIFGVTPQTPDAGAPPVRVVAPVAPVIVAEAVTEPTDASNGPTNTGGSSEAAEEAAEEAADAAPTALRRPRSFRFGTFEVTGAMTRESVRRVMLRHYGLLEGCRQRAATTDGISGSFLLSFVIAPAGVLESHAEEDRVGVPWLTDCITRAVSHFEFPTPERGTVAVRVPVEFLP